MSPDPGSAYARAQSREPNTCIVTSTHHEAANAQRPKSSMFIPLPCHHREEDSNAYPSRCHGYSRRRNPGDARPKQPMSKLPKVHGDRKPNAMLARRLVKMHRLCMSMLVVPASMQVLCSRGPMMLETANTGKTYYIRVEGRGGWKGTCGEGSAGFPHKPQRPSSSSSSSSSPPRTFTKGDCWAVRIPPWTRLHPPWSCPSRFPPHSNAGGGGVRSGCLSVWFVGEAGGRGRGRGRGCLLRSGRVKAGVGE